MAGFVWLSEIHDKVVSYIMNRIILASASPRRAELLAQIGVKFDVCVADIDETPMINEDPYKYVLRMAEAKADAVAHKVNNRIILASDTSVVIEGQILGKPENKQHGLDMLASLSGKTHQVLTSLCVVGKANFSAVSVTDVTFRNLTMAEMIQYYDSGEPEGKAGAYAIQGFAATFIERIDGSYSAVMGLPLYEVGQALLAEGVLYP